MRIGIDGRVLTDHYPGIGRALGAVIPSLAEQTEELVLIRGPEPESDRFPLAELARLGIETVRTPFGLRSVGEQFRLSAAVAKLELDVVLTPYFATALRWPCPRVTMVHDLIPLTVKGSLSTSIARLGYRRLLRAALDRSRMIVVPTQATAERLFAVESRHRSRTLVVPHAVDPRFRPVGHSEVEEARSRYRVGPRHVITVAGDRPHKNLDRLAAAWRALDREDRRDAVLVLAGTPSPRVEDPTIRVLGDVPDGDLRALYTGALMTVVPSLEEGFGLPAAESMACHTAVVCSDRPALRELVGEAALYFDPRDRSSIGATLARALRDEDLRDSLCRLGTTRVVDFTPDRVAAQLLEGLRAAADAGQ